MRAGWLKALIELEAAGEPAVLVTVLMVKGSAPREAGTKMVVTSTTQHDTIGGGNLEFTCIEAARLMLHGADGPVLREFPLGPGLGQCCGGHVSVLFEPLRAAQTEVAIFGAGHVGRALVNVLTGLPLRVTLIDSRNDALIDLPPDIRVLQQADPAAAVPMLPPGALTFVMTHDHQIDFTITAAALARNDLGAVGLIGSATKRMRFVSRLTRQGFSADMIARLVCPIGLPGIGGKFPAEIAISVAAQILQLRQERGEQLWQQRGDTGETKPMEPNRRVRLVHPQTTECGDCTDLCGKQSRATVAAINVSGTPIAGNRG